MHDEDFELPNSPLNQYLIDNNIETNLNKTKHENSQKLENKTSKRTFFNENLTINSTLKEFLLNRLVICQLNQIIAENLHLLSTSDEQLIKKELYKKQFDNLKVNFSSFLIILCLLLISYVASVYIAIFILTIFTIDIIISAIIAKFIINRINKYDNNLKNFLVFFKQIELSCLNYSLKQNFNVNETCLMHVNNFFNEIIEEFNQMNKNLYLHYNKNTKNLLELICLVQHSNNSNNFKPEFNSIRCLVKLNYLQLSELHKLLYLSLLNLNTKSIFELNLILNLIKILWDMIKFEKKSNKLLQIIKLNEEKYEINQNKFVLKHSSLSIHLRNALLLSYQLDDHPNNQELIENLTKILNLCDLYMKKLQKVDYLVEKHPRVVIKPNLDNKLEEKDSILDNAEDNCSEDLVIFEATPSTKGIKTDQNISVEIDKYENELLSRNFLNELNQALIDKKKAWKEREKLAVKLISDDNNVIQKKTGIFDCDHETLDNSMYKTKANLRKSRTKYNEYRGYKMNIPNRSFTMSFASELKAKRNKLMILDDEDEIFFE
jgi:hypothetical protein